MVTMQKQLSMFESLPGELHNAINKLLNFESIRKFNQTNRYFYFITILTDKEMPHCLFQGFKHRTSCDQRVENRFLCHCCRYIVPADETPKRWPSLSQGVEMYKFRVCKLCHGYWSKHPEAWKPIQPKTFKFVCDDGPGFSRPGDLRLMETGVEQKRDSSTTPLMQKLRSWMKGLWNWMYSAPPTGKYLYNGEI
ncbi:hypothetical protein E4T38_05757 [Aureobasidium subglaciale]|nr:hypothetical protein E4T38_05757 [Aureobasidium subglaciale]KAI5221135.1 hypothetical protein E4T40_05607 [Aureobasidium subglaciale]KAI5224410.1 hypothetical protein E4T41_05736 [Aureobasidium subglaciale]KAI5261013.1 hypothetical protein E4T46_05511 [Aureobasidium subglaciale]